MNRSLSLGKILDILVLGQRVRWRFSVEIPRKIMSAKKKRVKIADFEPIRDILSVLEHI